MVGLQVLQYLDEAEPRIVLPQMLVPLRVEGGGGDSEDAGLLGELLGELVVFVLVRLSGQVDFVGCGQNHIVIIGILYPFCIVCNSSSKSLLIL